ncbi:hypothetical protein KM868_11895 [Micrococcus luteus]|uniref:hypothetical protein n=1 Tax=Micrococcus luteus TaxID=1270 RepID=UPI001C212448|nr:hypothetical protein [Micrococcus luteus]MBU8764194.1 hypothetical protein [Micrococcus luteus]
MFHAIANGFNYLMDLLIRLFSWLLSGLYKLLQPIFDLIYIIFDFIYWIGVIIVKIVVLVFTIGRLLVGLIAGLFSTILGLSYTGSGDTGLPNSYTAVNQHLSPILGALQLDKVAYLILFLLWIATGFAAIKIIGNMRGGGGSA